LSTDPLKRIAAFRERRRTGEWTDEDFIGAVREAHMRWSIAKEHFGVKFPMIADAVAVIAPSFELSADEAEQIEKAGLPPSLTGRLREYFVRWARCPVTCGELNPYEPLVEILEHGGLFTAEHGMLELYSQGGGKLYVMPLYSGDLSTDETPRRGPRGPGRYRRQN
jgi:hypothetical protein